MPQRSADRNRISPPPPERSERTRVKPVLDNGSVEADEAADVSAFYAAQEASLPAYRAYGAARKARRTKK
jgi:hypothetical protein